MGGSTAAPLLFSGGSRFGEALAVSCRGPVLFLARLSISRAVGMFFEIRRSGRFAKSPIVRRAKSRSIYACAHGLFSAKRFGIPRSWSRACLLYVVRSSFVGFAFRSNFGRFWSRFGSHLPPFWGLEASKRD